jgi:hypothetical protein
MKLSVVFELLQYPGLGPIFDPPLQIAFPVGQGNQLPGVSKVDNEYSLPASQVSQAPVIKNDSPCCQLLKDILKSI